VRCRHAVLNELHQHGGNLLRLAPASDAAAALAIYRDKLDTAVTRAEQLELYIITEAASVVLGKSVSMVTYLCRTRALREGRSAVPG
jgi:hypothetical protein